MKILVHAHRLAAVFILALSLTACPKSDNAEAGKKDAARAVATGVEVAATGIEQGIPLVRSLREAGEVSPEFSLELARAALDLNGVMGETVTLAMDGTDAATLRANLDSVLRMAEGLQQRGTLRIKSSRSKLIFNLGVLAGRGALAASLRRLDEPGALVEPDAEARARLERARETLRRNDAALRESVDRLSSPKL